MYITACEGVQSTQNDDLGVMGGCRLLVAGEGEGAGVFDAALPVESVEDELLDRLRHVRQMLLRERLCVQRARGSREWQRTRGGEF